MAEKVKRILPNMDEIDKMVQIYKRLGERLTKVVAEVESIIEQYKQLSELECFVEPQGPIRITVPLRPKVREEGSMYV